MSDREETSISFRISSLSVRSFFYREPEWGNLTPSDVSFNIQWAGTANIENDLLGIDCLISGFLDKDGHERQDVFALETQTLFDVKGITKFKPAGEGINVPAEITIAFLGIAISTARGILIERLANTSVGGLILPAIDPRFIFEETVARLKDQSTGTPEGTPSAGSRKKANRKSKR